MTIPESRLSRWSHHGAQDSAKRTHEAIRSALDAYQWPQGMTYDFYLQGSYRNDTNVRGDSDVDVVLELNSAIRYDARCLSRYEQQALTGSFQPATYDWNDFRRETLNALESGFGKGMVAQGNKSIKLKANPPRLAADVVVCMEHRKYAKLHSYVKGITFLAMYDKRWVVNYPKDHYDNGAVKSSRAGDRYKRSVRMFKNARNYLESTRRIGRGLAPSYFLECLIYNAPDSAFRYGFQNTYCSIVNWMAHNRLDNLLCQNEQQYLFGPSPEQWSLENANIFVNQLVSLWNDWR